MIPAPPLAPPPRLLDIRETLLSHLPGEAVAAAYQLRTALPHWRRPALMHELGAPFAALWRGLAARQSAPLRSDIARLLVADLAHDLGTVLPERKLPASVLALYPDALARLSVSLAETREDYGPPDAGFLKDLRLAAGFSAPCGARRIDLSSRSGGRALAHVLARRPRAFPGFGRPCLRFYLDPRDTGAFSQEGFIACLSQAAQMLSARPELWCLVSKSWYNDPAMAEVSPHLAYHAAIPAAAGALSFANPPNPLDRERAMLTSRRRRALVVSGRYLPRAYTIVWPRDTLLDWAGPK